MLPRATTSDGGAHIIELSTVSECASSASSAPPPVAAVSSVASDAIAIENDATRSSASVTNGSPAIVNETVTFSAHDPPNAPGAMRITISSFSYSANVGTRGSVSLMLRNKPPPSAAGTSTHCVWRSAACIAGPANPFASGFAFGGSTTANVTYWSRGTACHRTPVVFHRSVMFGRGPLPEMSVYRIGFGTNVAFTVGHVPPMSSSHVAVLVARCVFVNDVSRLCVTARVRVFDAIGTIGANVSHCRVAVMDRERAMSLSWQTVVDPPSYVEWAANVIDDVCWRPAKYRCVSHELSSRLQYTSVTDPLKSSPGADEANTAEKHSSVTLLTPRRLRTIAPFAVTTGTLAPPTPNPNAETSRTSTALDVNAPSKTSPTRTARRIGGRGACSVTPLTFTNAPTTEVSPSIATSAATCELYGACTSSQDSTSPPPAKVDATTFTTVAGSMLPLRLLTDLHRRSAMLVFVPSSRYTCATI